VPLPLCPFVPQSVGCCDSGLLLCHLAAEAILFAADVTDIGVLRFLFLLFKKIRQPTAAMHTMTARRYSIKNLKPRRSPYQWGENLAPFRRDQHGVLDPHRAFTREHDLGLHCKGHSLFKGIGLPLSKEREFIEFEAYPMANEPRLQAGRPQIAVLISRFFPSSRVFRKRASQSAPGLVSASTASWISRQAL